MATVWICYNFLLSKWLYLVIILVINVYKLWPWNLMSVLLMCISSWEKYYSYGLMSLNMISHLCPNHLIYMLFMISRDILVFLPWNFYGSLLVPCVGLCNFYRIFWVLYIYVHIYALALNKIEKSIQLNVLVVNTMWSGDV